VARIELEVSEQVYRLWQAFLRSQQAARLLEAGVLGDWVAVGFMAHVDEYIKAGGPSLPEMDERKRLEEEAAAARRRLTKAQKRVLPMFNENDTVIPSEVARVLGMMPEEGKKLVEQWVEEDFLAPAGERDGEPAYTLSKKWQEYNLVANRPSLNAPRVLFSLELGPLSRG